MIKSREITSNRDSPQFKKFAKLKTWLSNYRREITSNRDSPQY